MKFAMTVVNIKTKPDTTGSADKFDTLSDGEGSESETDQDSLDEQDLWYATDVKAECEAMIDRTARGQKEAATCVSTEKVLQER